MTKKRFVVIDRDGTLILERHFLNDPDGVELIPGTAVALRRLRAAGLGLIVLSNQSAVGRGLIDFPRLNAVHDRLRSLLREDGVELDGIYICPHKPEDNCACRKPKTALLERAAQELDFEPRSSFVIGDKLSDVELGKRVGATTFLVRTGYGAQASKEHGEIANHTVSDIAEAAQIILTLLG